MDIKDEIHSLNAIWKTAFGGKTIPGKFESTLFLRLKMKAYMLKGRGMSFMRVNAPMMPERAEDFFLEYMESVQGVIMSKMDQSIGDLDARDLAYAKLLLFRNQAMRRHPPAEYPFFEDRIPECIGCYNTGFADEDVILDMITGHGDWPPR